MTPHCRDRFLGKHVSEDDYAVGHDLPIELLSGAVEHVPAPHRPTISLGETARVTSDGIQWILERRRGEKWDKVSFCRTRRVLVREAKRLLGHVAEPLLFLPERHDGLPDGGTRCHVCGRLKGLPTAGLPRQLFCIADRRRKPLARAAA